MVSLKTNLIHILNMFKTKLTCWINYFLVKFKWISKYCQQSWSSRLDIATFCGKKSLFHDTTSCRNMTANYMRNDNVKCSLTNAWNILTCKGPETTLTAKLLTFFNVQLYRHTHQRMLFILILRLKCIQKEEG